MNAKVKTAKHLQNMVAILAVSVGFLFCFATVLYAATTPEYERLQPIAAGLTAPVAVAVDAHDTVYVAESINNEIGVYDQEGVFLHTLTGLDKPVSVAVDGNGRVFVGNSRRGNVEVYSASFDLLHKLGSGDGEFLKPSGVAVDSAGRAYVADSKADQIKVYNPDGSRAFSFGTSGSNDGQFRSPTSIAINERAGEIIVSDFPLVDSWSGPIAGARIQVFDMSGRFLRSFGELGQGDGKLTRPSGVTVDEVGRVFVADAFQNVVQVFDRDGTFLKTVFDLAHPMRTPLGLAFDNSTGRLFVASLNTSKVEVFQIISGPCFDLTGDGSVTVADIEAIAGVWHQPARPPYDLDGDGVITVIDVSIVSSHFGESCH
jgi:DNA-binding beta-propeller fold protein YncE